MDRAQREKKLKILLPFLILISAIVWLPNFMGPKNKGERKVLPAKQKVHNDVSELSVLIASRAPITSPKESEFVRWGRNPFVTEGWKVVKVEEPKEPQDQQVVDELVVEPEPPMVLNGIFFNKQKPSALINDEVVGVGAEFGSFKVTAITKDVVTVTDGERYVDLRVQE